MKIRRPMLGVVTLLAVAAVLATTGCAAWRIRQSVDLARQSEPFQASPSKAAARLLVIGDSTAVGTGASSPEASLPGLLAATHPGLSIVNRAADGAKFSDMVRQLERSNASERFDVVLIVGGGNDVIRLTGEEELESDVARVAQLARLQGGLVIIMPSGNVGNAPFFFRPLSWLMTRRSQTLHGFVREAASDNAALYVNLYKERSEDPFALRPDELHAKDGLHPSDAGYRLWLQELDRQTGLDGRLKDLAAKAS